MLLTNYIYIHDQALQRDCFYTADWCGFQTLQVNAEIAAAAFQLLTLLSLIVINSADRTTETRIITIALSDRQARFLLLDAASLLGGKH